MQPDRAMLVQLGKFGSEESGNAGFFSNLSIRRKLIVIIMLVAGAALFPVFASFVTYDYLQMRKTMVANLTTIGQIIGDNSGAAVIFNDREASGMTLRALKSEENIIQAVLLDARGVALAAYARKGREQVPLARLPRADGHEFESRRLIVRQHIIYDGAEIGSVVIVSELDELYKRITQYGILLVAMLLLCAGLIYFLSARLQRSISEPILELVGTMSRVSNEHDFDLRVKHNSRDELGTLVDGFNEMLDQVRYRDIALQEANAMLERKSDELHEYAAKLERSNKELQDFASVASHDLQEPLRKVQAFSDRLVNSLNGSLTEQGREYLDRMLNAVRRMQVLINDLLNYSRVTTKAQPFLPVDLAVIVRDVLSDLEIRIEQDGHRIEVGQLPTIEADPLQMRQLFQNLIGNALKFHKPGEPSLVNVEASFTTPSSNGHGTAQAIPGSCRIIVRDNGIGFDEKYREQIFVIFQRLHARNEYEGTGIGLAICRKILDRHNGRIFASSSEGNGAEFVIDLPLTQETGSGVQP
jgi:signal transduction histidine kinase